MILTPDLRHELMYNYIQNIPYKRPLSNEEIFNVLSDKYDKDNEECASILLDKLMEYGLSLEEVVEYAYRREEQIT